MNPYARLTYIGLWCLADREGKLEDRPARIHAELFPYEGQNVIKCNDILDKLVQIGLIWRYSMNNANFIQIPKFLDHQKPHPHEAKSKIPEYKPNSNEVQNVIPCQNLVVECQSDSLNPSSLNPYTKPSPNGEALKASFNTFWETYPRKQAKPPAFKAWEKLHPKTELVDCIIKSVLSFKQTDGWRENDGKYIPLPATWLNQRRWEDDITVKKEKLVL